MDNTKKKLFDKYIQFVLEHRKKPESIHNFMEEMKLKESTFYKYFESFKNLETEFWKVIFESTIQNIRNQDVYASYSVNEKLLSFYYAWIETLKDYREFAKYTAKQESIFDFYPSSFSTFKISFENYCNELVEEGLATEEIESRMYITDKYKYALWYQPVSIFKFWLKDKSKDFEDTDALIEKTVNFSFDLMRSNSIDSFYDLAKFHIQHF